MKSLRLLIPVLVVQALAIIVRVGLELLLVEVADPSRLRVYLTVLPVGLLCGWLGSWGASMSLTDAADGTFSGQRTVTSLYARLAPIGALVAFGVALALTASAAAGVAAAALSLACSSLNVLAGILRATGRGPASHLIGNVMAPATFLVCGVLAAVTDGLGLWFATTASLAIAMFAVAAIRRSTKESARPRAGLKISRSALARLGSAGAVEAGDVALVQAEILLAARYVDVADLGAFVIITRLAFLIRVGQTSAFHTYLHRLGPSNPERTLAFSEARGSSGMAALAGATFASLSAGVLYLTGMISAAGFAAFAVLGAGNLLVGLAGPIGAMSALSAGRRSSPMTSLALVLVGLVIIVLTANDSHGLATIAVWITLGRLARLSVLYAGIRTDLVSKGAIHEVETHHPSRARRGAFGNHADRTPTR